MKIGILTFHLGPNHGGYLQAYCLQEFISSLGHDVEFINYKNEGHHQSEIFRPWIYRRPFKLYQAWIKEKVFQKAYKTLKMSNFTTTKSEVDWNEYDVIVVGSDVVWDYNMERLGRDPVYFGDFGTEFKGKLISYAASCGTIDVNKKTPEYVTKGLSNFDHIAVRDVASQTIVERSIGVAPQLVVDPTWLFIEPNNEKEKDPILLVYAYDVPIAFSKEIRAYAKKHQLKIVAIGYYHGWADVNEMRMSPLEWASMMRKATAVVSGTFHGTLYAIRCQTRFITIFNKTIENRVKRPLELSDLEYRMLKSPETFNEVMDREIDYDTVLKKLTEEVDSSKNYLKSILKDGETTDV